MRFIPRQNYLLCVALTALCLFAVHTLQAVDWDGGGDGTTWGCACNFSNNSVPGNGTNVCFDGCSPATATVNLGGVCRGTNSLKVQNRPCGNYTFQNGTIRATSGSQFNDGIVTFNSGGNFTTTGANNLWLAGQSGTDVVTVTFDGSTVCIGGTLCIGRCGQATLIVDNCACIKACFINFGQSGSAYGTLIVTDSRIEATGCQWKLSGCGQEGAVISTNSQLIAGEDFDMGRGCSTLCMTGCAPVGCVYSSVLCSGADFIIGHPSNVSCSTANLHNTEVTTATLRISPGTNNSRGYLTLTGQSKMTVASDSGPADSTGQSVIGSGNTSVLSLQDCSRWIVGGVTNSHTIIGSCGTIDLQDNAVIDPMAGCPGILRLDGGIIRGNGTVNTDIQLSGGVFGCGDTAGDVLLLTGSITQQGNGDEFTVKASGTIRLGTNDMLDNSSSNMDIQLQGGTLDINGTNQGANGSELGTLTVSSNSTIEFTSGDSSQDIYLSGGGTLSATLTISGWDGVGGASGTGGRLIFNGRPFGWANDDNGGVGFTGVDWGALGTRSELIDLGGGLYELVAFASAVPEPSTYLVAVSLLSFAVYHGLRRRAAK